MSEDKGKRNGEAYILVYRGRGRAFLKEWGTTHFLSFFGPQCLVMAAGRCVI